MLSLVYICLKFLSHHIYSLRSISTIIIGGIAGWISLYYAFKHYGFGQYLLYGILVDVALTIAAWFYLDRNIENLTLDESFYYPPPPLHPLFNPQLGYPEEPYTFSKPNMINNFGELEGSKLLNHKFTQRPSLAVDLSSPQHPSLALPSPQHPSLALPSPQHPSQAVDHPSPQHPSQAVDPPSPQYPSQAQHPSQAQLRKVHESQNQNKVEQKVQILQNDGHTNSNNDSSVNKDPIMHINASYQNTNAVPYQRTIQNAQSTSQSLQQQQQNLRQSQESPVSDINQSIRMKSYQSYLNVSPVIVEEEHDMNNFYDEEIGNISDHEYNENEEIILSSDRLEEISDKEHDVDRRIYYDQIVNGDNNDQLVLPDEQHDNPEEYYDLIDEEAVESTEPIDDIEITYE